MRDVLPFVFEALTMLALYVFAVLVALPFHRRITREGVLSRSVSTSGLNLVGRLLRPLVILAVTPLVLWLLERDPVVNAWLSARHPHVTAWWSFWIFVLGFDFVEAVALELYALRGRAFPAPRLLRSILRAVVVLVALLMILRIILGVDITPLLASTALLTAVVGFALQGVLGNLLAGMSLHLTRSVVPGDWVAIDDREGEVIDTNWRETRIRTTAGHSILIPNNAVASAVIHNMSQPDPLRRQSLVVGASYSDAPGDVIAALEEAAAAVPAVERNPAPEALVAGYMDFGINYELRFWTRQYQNHVPIGGDVGRMVWYQFKRRGIEIPFPMSDKLLNDFMEVVYTQRRLASDETQIRKLVADLVSSEFGARLVVNEAGHSLLSEEEWGQLARHMRRVRYTVGETLFRQGDAGESCYVVTRGQLRGTIEYEAGVGGSAFDVGVGAVVGEMSLMTGQPRTATLRVAEDTELIEIPAEAFVRLLSLRPEIPDVLAGLIADRAARNEKACENMKAMKATRAEPTLERAGILRRFLRLLGR